MIDLKSLPSNPGCYIYKDIDNNIIYVGKAKNLKKRVSSYFQKKDHDVKTIALVEHIYSLDYIITDNEVEALILENTLIKKHRPKYNISLKDSKRYASIEIRREEFPRLLVAREKKEGGEYYGPFVSGLERDYIYKLLIKTFKLRTCKRLPKKTCLRYHIKLCEGPCVNNISPEEYDEKIKNIRMILKGNTKELIDELKAKMTEASENCEFEKALELRDQVTALEHLKEKQNMERSRTYDEDIIHYLVKDEQVFLLLFNIYKGTLSNKSEFVFEYRDGFLEEFLVQYYSDNEIPSEVIISEKVDESIDKFLSHKKGSKVKLTVPKVGEKKQLLELVKKNVEISFFGDMIKVDELQKHLKLKNSPTIIECFDISHLSGTLTVGSMVQFRNGKADKSNYRKFKIKSPEAFQNDFAAIGEVVKRRYLRLKEENQKMPDLIIIDGGRGQLSSAIEELIKLSLRIPIISIAKKFEEIHLPGTMTPLRLDKSEKALLYIQEIRDEAHRFAIGYNKKLRSMRDKGKLK